MPRSTSASPNFLRRPRMSRIGGLSEDISSFPRHARACGHPRLTVYAAKTWMPAFAGMTESLAARRRVRRRIVAGHAGYPVAREYGHGCGAGRRRNAEPLLVHLGHGAVELHALDDDVERVAKRGRILARRRRPHEAGRIEIGQLELRAVLRRPGDRRVARDIGVGAPSQHRLHGVGLRADRLDLPADLAFEVAAPCLVGRSLVDGDDLAL